MGNLARWRELGVHAVVGTSGFDAARITEVRDRWGSGPPHCLIVPNFSIGAVVMMRLAEIAAPHFRAAEIIELHHDRKADAPSGTALATAARIAGAAPQERHRRVDRAGRRIPGGRRRRGPGPRRAPARAGGPSGGDLRKRGRDADDPPRYDRSDGLHAGSSSRRAGRGRLAGSGHDRPGAPPRHVKARSRIR